MFKLLKSKDTCTIYEELGTDRDGRIIKRIIFEGNCDYQVGGGGDTSLTGDFLQVQPVVFIDTIVNLKPNMKIEVVTHYDNVIKGSIENFVYASMELFYGSKIWIREGRDD